jgi:hypothetical protein
MSGGQIIISDIIRYIHEESSYQLKEAEFYQIFTQVEDGQINTICRANGMQGINFSEYFYENIRRFIRSYLKKKANEENQNMIKSFGEIDVLSLIKYFIIRFFETEASINKEWNNLRYQHFEFLNEENNKKLDSVFLKEIKDREKSMVDYFHYAFEDDKRLSTQYYTVLDKRLRTRIEKQIRFLKNHNDLYEIRLNTLHELLIFIRGKIKAYKYYYEASTDNYLICSNVFKSTLEKVLKEFYPDNKVPIEFVDVLPDPPPSGEYSPMDPMVINEVKKWIEENFNEQDKYLKDLYDIYKEHKEWKREKFELPEFTILTWEDIAREFNEKFYNDGPEEDRKTVATLKMRIKKLHERVMKKGES